MPDLIVLLEYMQRVRVSKITRTYDTRQRSWKSDAGIERFCAVVSAPIHSLPPRYGLPLRSVVLPQVQVHCWCVYGQQHVGRRAQRI